MIVRDRRHAVGWLYTRAALPGLINGWILADAYHDIHPNRPVVVAASEGRLAGLDVVLKQPAPTLVLEVLLHAIERSQAHARAVSSAAGQQAA
jgi:hypothetical protein